MKAFISYSHEDATLLDHFHRHLSALRRTTLLESWDDREILAGQNIDNEVDRRLEQADLFLPLISPDFIASNYCYEREFQRALELHGQGRILIIPVILRDCDWEIPVLRRCKALPQDGKAITSRHWYSRDEAFKDVAEGLREMISRTKSPNAPLQPEFRGANSSDFCYPENSAARELLWKMFQHPNPEEQGLTEITLESPFSSLNLEFIPNITANGKTLSGRKRILTKAIDELVNLGWLLPPLDGQNVRIYELDPEAPKSFQFMYSNLENLIEDKLGGKETCTDNYSKLADELELPVEKLENLIAEYHQWPEHQFQLTKDEPKRPLDQAHLQRLTIQRIR